MASRNPYYQGPPSDHFDGLRFFNPGQAATDRGLRDILRWKLRETAASWPSHVPVTPAKPDVRVEDLRVTMVGHATLLIQIAGLNLVTDPVWAPRASPLSFAGPKRVTAPGIDFDDLPPIDAVLLSHNHYDHLDVATLKRLDQRDRPLIVTPLGNDTIIRRHLPNARIATGDWCDSIRLRGGLDAHLVSAHHWSARGSSDRRMALWCGFVVTSASRSVYFAGDTGYGDGQLFRDIGTRFPKIDFALIPIGAYAPRWFMRAQHTDPEEAVRILRDLGAKKGVGIHWGSFQLTDEPREEPVDHLAAALLLHRIQPVDFPAALPGDVFNAG